MKTLIIDCNFLCHRAIYATGHLTNDNRYTGVMYGFLMQLLTLSTDFETNKFIFCWDSRNSRRKDMYPQYKEKRREKRTKEEIEDMKLNFEQFTKIHEYILPTLGFKNNFLFDGYEGDDIMAMVALYYEKDFLMVTSDNDMLQILDLTDMYNPNKGLITTKKDFIDTWGIQPKQWAKVKAIAGCKTDCVEGIAGVGEKTAVKYLLGTLNKKTATYKKIRNVEKDGKMFKRNHKLVTLPFPGLNINDMLLKIDDLQYDKFIQICDEFFFASFKHGKFGNQWKNLFMGLMQ